MICNHLRIYLFTRRISCPQDHAGRCGGILTESLDVKLRLVRPPFAWNARRDLRTPSANGRLNTARYISSSSTLSPVLRHENRKRSSVRMSCPRVGRRPDRNTYADNGRPVPVNANVDKFLTNRPKSFNRRMCGQCSQNRV